MQDCGGRDAGRARCFLLQARPASIGASKEGAQETSHQVLRGSLFVHGGDGENLFRNRVGGEFLRYDES
jgi:hypothetical protein